MSAVHVCANGDFNRVLYRVVVLTVTGWAFSLGAKQAHRIVACATMFCFTGCELPGTI